MPFGLGATARRRRRAERHEAIRMFADEVGWQVQGLLPGTTRRYPAVGLLAGTVDPDLVVVGSFGGRPGELAGLLTRDAAAGTPEGSGADRRATDLRDAGIGSGGGSGGADARVAERRGGDRRAGDRRGSEARDGDGSARAERGPDRRVGDRRAGERVLLLAAAEVGPRVGGLRIRVVGGAGAPAELDLTSGTPELLDGLRPWLRPALERGDLVVGEEVVLGELTLAVVGPWRPELARTGALRRRVELAHQLAAQLDPS